MRKVLHTIAAVKLEGSKDMGGLPVAKDSPWPIANKNTRILDLQLQGNGFCKPSK